MIYLLDTNTCIYFLNRNSERIVSQFKRFSPSVIKLASITAAELFSGAEKSKAKKKNWTIIEKFVSTFEIIPFEEKSSKAYPTIRASLEKAGIPIGPMDLLIASISIANNFVLVTNNVKEFKRVKGLTLENWL